MNFLDAKELQKHAMKARYGWRRFFLFGIDNDIQSIVLETLIRVRNKDGEFDEYQARLDFIREFPIKD